MAEIGNPLKREPCKLNFPSQYAEHTKVGGQPFIFLVYKVNFLVFLGPGKCKLKKGNWG